jgi:hypothetical protein
MSYFYNPVTGELINTATHASWMGSTELAPPSFDAAVQGAFFADGAWRVVDATPIPIQVPASVSMRQARLALASAGLLDAVSSSVSAGSQNVQIEWEYATAIDRYWPTLLSLQLALGWSDAQMDALFVAAAQL